MYKRKDNESKYEHHKRLVLGKLVDKTLADVDYAELSMEVYGKPYVSDNCRKMLYGSRNTIQLLEQEKLDNIQNTTSSDIINEIEEKQRELKKERIKLQTEKLEYNKWLREQARSEMFEEKIIESIKNNITPLVIPKRIKLDTNQTRTSVLLISDIHYGKEFEIKGFDGEILNQYSVGIFEERMWRLLDIVVNNLEKEQINHIHIFNLADSIEGILRSNSSLMKLRHGITDSIMLFTNFIANWLNELSKYATVDYYQNTGNHADYRILTGTKGDFNSENAEKLICWALTSILDDNKNITLHEEQNQGLIYTEILDFNFLSTHGDKERKLENSIKDYNMLYNKNIDYLLVGHKHFASESTIGINKEIIQAPSLIGIDDYSMSIKKSANAGSKMFILEKGYGRSIDYNIKLD